MFWSMFCLICLVAGTAGTAAGTAASFAQERAGLVALYNATGGEHWSDSSTNEWLHNTCHCQWAGVHCLNESACDDSPVYGVVRRGGKGLVGTLPSLNGDPSESGVCSLNSTVYISVYVQSMFSVQVSERRSQRKRGMFIK